LHRRTRVLLRASCRPNCRLLSKDQILAALDKLGGVDYLVRLGNEQPGVFGSLLGRVIPTQLALNGDGELLGVVLIPAKRPVGSRDLSPAPMPQIEGSIVDAEVIEVADAHAEVGEVE
jgi:hypothetical protein